MLLFVSRKGKRNSTRFCLFDICAGESNPLIDDFCNGDGYAKTNEVVELQIQQKKKATRRMLIISFD